MCILVCLFFFKQKTAYEMRISDWSSDVCSSDLAVVGRIVEIYINVDEGKDSLRNIRESLRDPAFVQMHSFELPKIPAHHVLGNTEIVLLPEIGRAQV